MALPSLAAEPDLDARDIEIADDDRQDMLLAVASAVVRSAARSPILRNTSTVDLTAYGDQYLDMPGKPVVSVAAVELDGRPVDGHRLVDGGRLWLRQGWGWAHEPTVVTVTLTHGFQDVPPDLVNLVCNLVSAGNHAIDNSDSFDPRLVTERIDDYSVTFAQGADAVADVMSLPAGTRRHLARRFGGGATMIEYR